MRIVKICGKLSNPPPSGRREGGRSLRRDDKDIKSMNRYEYRELKNFCYQYPWWHKQLEELNENLGVSASSYDDVPTAKSMVLP